MAAGDTLVGVYPIYECGLGPQLACVPCEIQAKTFYSHQKLASIFATDTFLKKSTDTPNKVWNTRKTLCERILWEGTKKSRVGWRSQIVPSIGDTPHSPTEGGLPSRLFSALILLVGLGRPPNQLLCGCDGCCCQGFGCGIA